MTIWSYFIKQINEYNKQNSKQQIITINNTIKIINDFYKISFLNKIIERQIEAAKVGVRNIRKNKYKK